MNEMIPFEFSGRQVRVVEIDGEPHFAGKDVTDALGYADHVNAMKLHCKGVVKRHPLRTPGGTQEMRVLTEADVLRLVVNSKLPSAEAFERWVFEEVLPAVRRTGAYPVQRAAQDQSKLTGALAIAECFTRLLKPSPSSQVAMLAHIAKDYGINASFLPAYVIDATPDAGGSSMPTKPLTALLGDHGIKIGVRAYNQLLADAGFLVERTRKTTSSRAAGNAKHFWSLTDAGLRYGKNITHPNSPRETQPHWYVDRFAVLHAEISARLEGVTA